MSSAQSLRYRKTYRLKQHRGIPTSLVPADEARAHLTRLTEIGWSLYALEDITGITDQGMRFITEGTHTRLERRTHAAIMSVPYTLAVPDCVPDNRFVPPHGAVRRFHALMALGWTRDLIQPHTRGTNVQHLSRSPYNRMEAGRWRDIDRAYRLLHMTQGPSTLGATRAIAKGYAPPMAWDDIDSPDEVPSTATEQPWTASMTSVERFAAWNAAKSQAARDRVEDIEWLCRSGAGSGEILARTGTPNWDALEQFLRRHDRGDLIATLKALGGAA